MARSSRVMSAVVFASVVGVAGNVVASNAISQIFWYQLTSLVHVFVAAALVSVAREESLRKAIYCSVASGFCIVSAISSAAVTIVEGEELQMCLATGAIVASIATNILVYFAKLTVRDVARKLMASVSETQKLAQIKRQVELIEVTAKRLQEDPMQSINSSVLVSRILNRIQMIQEYILTLETTAMTHQERKDSLAMLKYYLEGLQELCSRVELGNVLCLAEIECFVNRLEIIDALVCRLEEYYERPINVVRV